MPKDDDGITMTKDDELVLCVPRTAIEQIGMFNGYHHTTSTADGKNYLTTLLQPGVAKFVRRGDCETDANLKQIIPYIAMRHKFAGEWGSGRILRYNRSKHGGEKRLTGKASIGIGGHVNPGDHDGDFMETFQRSWRRELSEEVRMDTKYRARIAGLINDDSTAVGSVHFGVLIVLDLELPCVYPGDLEAAYMHFVPLDHICGGYRPRIHDEFEEWSKIVLTSGVAFTN